MVALLLLTSLTFPTIWTPGASVAAHGTICYAVSSTDLTCPLTCTDLTCNTNINCLVLCGLGNAHAECDTDPPGPIARCECHCNP
jgi:hypothetical protein